MKEVEGEAGRRADRRGRGGHGTFTLIVERAKVSGGWKTEEVIPGVTLQEVAVDGHQEVRVAYTENKVPHLVELLIPEASAPWPSCGRVSRSRH